MAMTLLTGAISLAVYGSLKVREPTFTQSVREILPAAPEGWRLQEKEIASSPEMKEAVGELLNFNDGTLADYLGPAGERISVYIAYWRPGKMSHRLVAGHTPDVCWPGNGWRKAEGSRLPAKRLPNGKSVPPGEARVFMIGNDKEYVWYWHVVGSKSLSYQSDSSPPWHAAITDLFKKGLNQREEQFFIRVSASTDLAKFMEGPILPNLLGDFPWQSTEPHNQ